MCNSHSTEPKKFYEHRRTRVESLNELTCWLDNHSGKTLRKASWQYEFDLLPQQQEPQNANLQVREDPCCRVVWQLELPCLGGLLRELQEHDVYSLFVIAMVNGFDFLFLPISLLGLERRLRRKSMSDKDWKTQVQIHNWECDSMKPFIESVLVTDLTRGVYVERLSEVAVSSLPEAFQVLWRGLRQRQVGSTHMNEKSSRSHAVPGAQVFTLYVEAHEKRAGFISNAKCQETAIFDVWILSRSCSSDLDKFRIGRCSTMGIMLNLGSTLKPEAVAADYLLPDEVDENSPRALYGTDSPVANGWTPTSPKANRPRRTADVLIEEMRMLSFMKRDRLNEKFQSCIFGMEEVYPVHVAAYLGDVDAMNFVIASRADPNKKTSMGRTALEVARDFNNCGSHDRFIAMLVKLQSTQHELSHA
eukprot:s3508_g12.t1